MPQLGSRRPRLGDILVARGACTARHIERALEDQVVYDGRLGTLLVELGVITEEQLARALSAQHGLPAKWGEIEVEAAAVALLTPAGVRRWRAVPLRLGRRRLDILVSEVRDPTRLDEISFAVGREVWPVLVTETRLWALMSRYYGVPAPRRRAPAARSAEAAPAPRAAPREEPAVELVGLLASDQEILAELQQDASRQYLSGGLRLSSDADAAETVTTPAPARR